MRIATLVLAVALSAGSTPAQIENIVITSAASFQQGMPVRGSIASVFCTGLKGINGIVAAGGFPLPLELAGVRVKIGGAEAPLFAVADLGLGFQQVNLQVPWEAVYEPYYGTTVTVQQSGEEGTLVASPLATPPGFFQMPDGSGAFQHAANYALVSAANPARAGEVVTGYLTGLGNTIPQVATGQPAPADPPAVVDQLLRPWFEDPDRLLPPRFQVLLRDGAHEEVVDPLFLGLAPGLVGVYQVNFVVPQGSTGGRQEVRLTENSCGAMFGDPCAYVKRVATSVPVPMAVQ